MNNPICSLILIKKSQTEFEIIIVYVDDLNLVRTSKEFIETTKYLKKEFETKVFGKKKYLSGLIKHFPTKVSVHQSTYIKKTLKCFNTDKTYPLSSTMIVQPFDMKKDSFRPHENDENLLGLEAPYLSVIGVLIYLANCIVQIL